jgi:hypothetical protein
MTSPLSHVGHATVFDGPWTYFSNSLLHPRQRYS